MGWEATLCRLPHHHPPGRPLCILGNENSGRGFAWVSKKAVELSLWKEQAVGSPCHLCLERCITLVSWEVRYWIWIGEQICGVLGLSISVLPGMAPVTGLKPSCERHWYFTGWVSQDSPSTWERSVGGNLRRHRLFTYVGHLCWDIFITKKPYYILKTNNRRLFFPSQLAVKLYKKNTENWPGSYALRRADEMIHWVLCTFCEGLALLTEWVAASGSWTDPRD